MKTQPFIPLQVQNPPYDLERPVDGGALHVINIPLLVTRRPEYVRRPTDGAGVRVLTQD